MLLCACLVSCGRQRAERVKVEVGGVPLSVELARTDEERGRGLMGRRCLGADEGMLFIYEPPEEIRLWMKNTAVPLSAAFADEGGRIFRIVDMEPYETRIHPSGAPARYALEVRRGWFEGNGIGTGDRIVLNN